MGKIMLNSELYGVGVEANPEVPAGANVEDLENLMVDNKYYAVGGGSTKKLYLKSNGKQYINTGIKAKGSISMLVEFFLDISQFDTSESWVNVFCGQDANTSNSIDFGYNQSSGAITFQYAGGYGDFNVPILPCEIHKVGLIKGRGFLDNTQYAIFSPTSFTANQNITLFAGNEGGTISNYGKLCMTNCKIWDGNTLALDLVPDLDSNNEPCMKDNLTNNFYTNQGTGSFAIGEL